MGRHRLDEPTRVRPRVGRLAAATLALAVTGVALLSGIGVIDLDAGSSDATLSSGQPTAATSGIGSAPAETDSATPRSPASSPAAPKTTPSATPDETPDAPAASDELPDASGQGRRVVFSIADQRVWLVNGKNAPVSTYLVSGSVTDNLKPGTYDVYSRSRWAVGIDDSGVMEYFVRFTRGKNAPIGFHSIPTKNGKKLQTEGQLGTPQSHGCIRQRMKDAQRLWEFAPVGTEVVVV